MAVPAHNAPSFAFDSVHMHHPTPPVLRALSSMATRAVLADLVQAWQQQGGAPVQIESIGGVDAARRVQDGEPWDVVFLSRQALDKLIAAQHLLAGSRVDLVRSGVAVAVPQGAAAPDISSAAAVRRAVEAASAIAYSTGPSGVALQALFAGWGLSAALAGRSVQAPPGVPVARLLAEGQAALGFQQYSELLGAPGIDIVGPLPPEIQINTTFSGAIGSTCSQVANAQALLAFMAAPAVADLISRHGMQPARSFQ